MTLPFEKLPDSSKPEAAAAILDGKTWMHWGQEIERPSDDELRRWLPPRKMIRGNIAKTFVALCDGDFGEPRNFTTRPPKRGIQALKRKRADVLIAARPELSDRELARLAGVSHTYIAMRRKVATNSHAPILPPM
jgi:hypothetical protein